MLKRQGAPNFYNFVSVIAITRQTIGALRNHLPDYRALQSVQSERLLGLVLIVLYFRGLYDLIRLSPDQGPDGTDYWDP